MRDSMKGTEIMRAFSFRSFVLGLTVLAATGACSDDESKTTLNPEGPPMIRQIFMDERVMVDTNGDGVPDVERTRTQLAFGHHDDIRLEDDPQDGVSNAIASGNKINVVIDELLDGSTLEDILCEDLTYSAIAQGSTPDDIADCAGVDRSDCTAACTHLDADGVPVGIRDRNEDGAPESTMVGGDTFTGLKFKDGIVEVLCDGVSMPIITDGASPTFWNPSGNQQIPAGDIGIRGIGPAIVLIPEGMRTGSSCTIEFDDSVVDKDGHPVCAPPDGDVTKDCPGGENGGNTSEVEWGTQVFALLGSAPPDGQENVNLGQVLLLQFNLDVDETTVAGNVTISDEVGEVAADYIVETNDAAIISIEVTGGLQANTMYTIHVNSGANGLLEIFGGSLAADIDRTFTTGDAPPIPDASTLDAATLDAGAPDA
jgi:hypothetical protein